VRVAYVESDIIHLSCYHTTEILNAQKISAKTPFICRLPSINYFANSQTKFILFNFKQGQSARFLSGLLRRAYVPPNHDEKKWSLQIASSVILSG
jgi:hypothetical protein